MPNGPLLEPLLPTPACETSKGGRPEKHPRREIVDAIRYVVVLQQDFGV
jgi:hypothetical protein